MMLLERENELQLLSGLLEELPTSGGKVVLIRGEAGIGKTSLVNSFIAAVANDAHVWLGYCDDLQAPQAFGPLWDIARQEPSLLEALHNSDRQKVMLELFELLSGTLRPNVVVIEDTHWSDEATLDAIKFVGRRISRTNGLLVLTYRDEEIEVDNPLRTVLGSLSSDSVVRVTLSGLSRDAVAEIVTGSGLDADAVLRTTRGNPFFVTEMAMTVGENVPASVRDSVMARFGKLSILARELLRHLSVIPERTTREELQSLIGSSETQLSECERMGLLEVDAVTVAFRHDLIRRAIESSLTATESTEIHQALLDVLPEDTDPVRVAYHAHGAGDVDRLIDAARLAVAAAVDVGANREAAAQFRMLEPHLERIPLEDRARLLLDWARIEYYMADVVSVELVDRAIRLYREIGSQRELARALTFAVSVKESHARIVEAEQHAREAVELLEDAGPSSDLAAALSRHADLLIHQGKGLMADEVSDRAIEVAEQVGNSEAASRALNVKGMLAHVRGEEDGLALIEQARHQAAQGGHRFEEVMALRGAAYTALEINDIGLQADFARSALDAAIRYEFPLLEAEANAVIADALMRSGKWNEADDLASESLGSHANADVHFSRILGLIRMRGGRSGGRKYLQDAWAIAEASTEIDYLLHVAAGLVEEMWLEERLERDMTDAFNELVFRGIEYEFPWVAGWLAFWLWRVGEIEEIPGGIPEPHRMMMNGDIASAAAFWENRELPYERAITLSCGDATQRLLALEVLEDLGADSVAAKLRKELRSEGVTVGRGKARATREHSAGLTARQAEVLTLLIEGLANSEIADQLFLSPRTVENHVSAVLAKLEASTREEAVSRAADLGIAGVPHI